MDEPNSNLDGEGEAALTAAIEGIKARGGIVVVIAHRPSALAAVDLVAVIQNGKMTAFGPKETILGPKETIIGNPVHREPPPAAVPANQEARARPSARVTA